MPDMPDTQNPDNYTLVRIPNPPDTRQPTAQRAIDLALIWVKHYSLNNWTLQTKESKPRKLGHSYPYMFGWVDEKWHGKSLEAGCPKTYDPETDSDAESFGLFQDLAEAMLKVEQNFNPEIYI